MDQIELPKLITFEVTQRCNCRCEMCRFWSEDSSCADSNELKLSDLEKIVLNINNVYQDNGRSLFLGITGGEPFLRKDIVQLFKFFNDYNIKYDVITNFSLPDSKIVREFADCNPDRLNVSLDGVGEAHNLVRGVDIFDKVFKNMKLFQKLRPNIPIKINSTINKKSLNELEKILYFAMCNKFELNFQHLNFTTPKLLFEQKEFEEKNFGQHLFHEPTFYNLTKKEALILKKKVKEIRKIADVNNYRVTFLPELDKSLEDWYLKPNLTMTNNKCDSNRLRIKPDGELVHCERFSYGNLLTDNFLEIIKSDQANKIRRIIKENNMPFCRRCCLRFRNFIDY